MSTQRTASMTAYEFGDGLCHRPDCRQKASLQGAGVHFEVTGCAVLEQYKHAF